MLPRSPLARAAVLGLATAWPCLAGQDDPAHATRVVLDQSSVPLRTRSPAKVGLAVHVIEPRVLEGGEERTLRLPVAWRMDPGPGGGQGTVVLDEIAGAELRATARVAEAREILVDQVRRRAAPFGIALSLLTEEEDRSILAREARPTDVSGGASAWLRALTRGDARDRWSVTTVAPAARDKGESVIAAPATAPAALPPGLPPLLLHVDLVSLGLHQQGSSYGLPAPLLHATVRARLWNLETGSRDWDRTLMLGRPLPEASEERAAAVADLLQAAADQVAGELWPSSVPESALDLADLDLATPSETGPAPVAPVPVAPAAPEGAKEARLARASAADEQDDLAGLLARLAAARQRPVTGDDPWTSLARDVEKELTPAVALALRCAEDPAGAAAGVAAERMGLSLAEAYSRLEDSDALRRALAADLARRVAELSGDDGPVREAAPLLVAALAGTEVPPAEARLAAAPLLERARSDGARSASGIAALLIACRLAPDAAADSLRALLPPSS